MNFDYDLTDQTDALAFQKLATHIGRSYADNMMQSKLVSTNPSELARTTYIEYAECDIKWVSDRAKAEQLWVRSFTHAFGKVREARTMKRTLEDFFNATEVP